MIFWRLSNMVNIKACHTSKSNEHYTPLSFLLRVYEFYGGNIDLDPCCNDLSRPNVLAHLHYDQALDGLALPWIGKVFVNPPYGRSLIYWSRKIVSEYENGNSTESLLLVPSRTDTAWTRHLGGYTRCHLSKRLKFYDEKGREQDSAPFPSALFYLGKRQDDFKKTWGSQGTIFTGQSVKLPAFDKRAYQREYMRKRRASAD
jgi:hypothetical protein